MCLCFFQVNKTLFDRNEKHLHRVFFSSSSPFLPAGEGLDHRTCLRTGQGHGRRLCDPHCRRRESVSTSKAEGHQCVRRNHIIYDTFLSRNTTADTLGLVVSTLSLGFESEPPNGRRQYTIANLSLPFSIYVSCMYILRSYAFYTTRPKYCGR